MGEQMWSGRPLKTLVPQATAGTEADKCEQRVAAATQHPVPGGPLGRSQPVEELPVCSGRTREECPPPGSGRWRCEPTSAGQARGLLC